MPKIKNNWLANLKKSDPVRYKLQCSKYRRLNPEKFRATQYAWYYRNTARFLFTTTKATAKKRGLHFSLTLEWVEKQLARNKCAITGIKLKIKGGRNPFQASIDRKDSSIGYIESNCQMVCLIYNYAKSTFSHRDVMKLARLLCKK